MSCAVFLAAHGDALAGVSDAGSVAAIAVLVLLAGVVAGWAVREFAGRWRADAIERDAKLRADESDADARARLKEADVTARARVMAAREEFEAFAAARRAELSAREAKLDERAAFLDRKSEQLDRRDAESAQRARAAETAAAEADRRLAETGRMSYPEARKEVLARVNAELRADAAILSRHIQEAARERGEACARRILADCIQRCAVKVASECTTARVGLPGPEMKGRILGRDGRNARAFETATGVSLLLDDAPDAVIVSCFDPRRRELARRALEALVANGRIHPDTIDAAVTAARADLARADAEAGRAAACEAGVQGLSEQTVALVGSLALRTSYQQNVLRHSVEVALLAGALAGELGLNEAKARRIGFLHDVGKGLPSDVKGAHATLGAAWLKAHGEDEDTCAAVAAHHAEAGLDGGVYGTLCATADAISSARPGARRENVSEYASRLGEIERIARAFDGVKEVFAVQAGRDLRVMVDPRAISDSAAEELAASVCREISARVRFPGQIRVTVIRETRCIEYAK